MADTIVVLFVLLGVVVVATIKQWPECYRRARSTNWPTTSATIESGEVSTIRYKSSEISTATPGHSYQLNGNYYSGYHSQEFDREQKAQSYVDAKKGQVVQISFDPQKPETSVMRPEPPKVARLA